MKIIGTGSALPQKVISNEMLSQILDTNDEWIATRTGIHERRIISNENLIDLAVKSCKSAIADAGIEPSELDFIICSNVANNFITPAMSCIVQGEIGATCPCIDLNGACAGFIYALQIAESFLQTKKADRILIVCAEEPTKFCNWHERDTSVLFGDGAGAVVLTHGNELKSIRLTTSSKYDVLYYRRKMEKTPYDEDTEAYNPLVMKGRDVFKMAVKASTKDVQVVLDEAHVDVKDVNWFLLHQANARIIESIKHNIGAENGQFPLNLDRYGNTSSASIPILIDELYKNGEVKTGDILVLSAFGAGFVSGACVMQRA